MECALDVCYTAILDQCTYAFWEMCKAANVLEGPSCFECWKISKRRRKESKGVGEQQKEM